VWPELLRLIPASVFWPIGLAVYPKDVKREEQIKTAIQWVAQFASLALAFIGLGPAVPFAKAQQKTGGTKQEQKKSGGSTLGYGIELYPQSAGIDAGLMISPWYATSHKLPDGLSLSTFGFAEVGERKAQFFTNHSLSLMHVKSAGAMLTTEVGGTTTSAFLQVGPKFSLTKAPWLAKQTSKFMKSLVVGSLWRVRGPTHYQEWYLSWASKEVALFGGLKISTEGFMRFRPGSRAAVGEPQVILRHPKIPHTQFMTEFWMIGTQPTIRLGLQFAK